jgi:GH35 family endo-1,4-beta-xylanase
MNPFDPNHSLPRREVLKLGAASAAASLLGIAGTANAQPAGEEEAKGLGAEDAAARNPESKDRKFVRFYLREADDSPLAADRMKLLYARDMANDPLPQTVRSAEGRARIALTSEPIQVVCRLNVPNFGEVYCYADNNGKGYTKPLNADLAADAALTRLRRVRDALQRATAEGVPSDPELEKHLEAAGKPIPKEPGKQRTAVAYEVLAHGLHAGEMLALGAARHRISKLASPRKEFKFGALVSGYDNEGPVFVDHFKRAFNRATVAWYTWGKEEPPEQRVGYDRMENSIKWCEQNGIDPKGFGYCYMARGATPEWIRPVEMPASEGGKENSTRAFNERWPYERIKELYVNVVRNTAKRYHGRVRVMEIINEAHDKANLWHLDHQHVLDITKAVLDAAREGSADVQRMINHCCMWGEYAKNLNPHGERAWSPYRYVKDCLAHGVTFEVLGLQLYYPQFDVFEIDRMLDKMGQFNKPMEITEIATSSAPGLDPHSMRPKTSAPGWHGPWSEATQADWLEAMYTLCYSKPLFQGVTWWDFSDHRGRFWPFGGILKEDQSPKQSYNRLIELQKRWGVGKA